MNIGILGTGMVGRTLGSRLVEACHHVRLGARSPDNETARDWAAHTGHYASAGDFADAAGHGEIVINATSGEASLAALEQAGAATLAHKVLIDVANPLRHDEGGLTLTVANTDSLGEQIQRAFPDARVVKALNTMNCQVMAHPGRVPGDHVVFTCGEDAEAKATVGALLGTIGWPDERIIDLGGIREARGTEAWLLLWLPLMKAFGTADFNVSVQRAG